MRGAVEREGVARLHAHELLGGEPGALEVLVGLERRDPLTQGRLLLVCAAGGVRDVDEEPPEVGEPRGASDGVVHDARSLGDLGDWIAISFRRGVTVAWSRKTSSKRRCGRVTSQSAARRSTTPLPLTLRSNGSMMTMNGAVT